MGDKPLQRPAILALRDSRPLISEVQIQAAVSRLAESIASDLSGRDVAVIGVLKGCFIFLSDLLRRMAIKGFMPQVDFIRVSSYGAGTTRGELKLTMEPTLRVSGRSVLLVDDIVDSGWTLRFLTEWARGAGAVQVGSCVLLDKPSRRETDIAADYVGFIIPNQFVVGYGLDFNEQYRGLPHILTLK